MLAKDSSIKYQIEYYDTRLKKTEAVIPGSVLCNAFHISGKVPVFLSVTAVELLSLRLLCD